MPKISKQQPRATGRKRSGVIGRIKPIGFSPDEGIKINIYGRSGTGKTTLWSTFPKPILAIICSGSINPGELRSIDTAANRKSIKHIVIESSDELAEIMDYQRNEAAFKTVVLDHVTGLQDMVLKEILGLDELPAQKSWGMASRSQYGQCGLQMKERLRVMLDLSVNCNVVIVAQERTFDNDEGEDSEIIKPYICSALTPAVAGWLGPACDYVVQTLIRQRLVNKSVKIKGKEVVKLVETNDVEYCIRTAPHAVYASKFRLPKGKELPEVIVDPNYGKIISLIRGGNP